FFALNELTGATIWQQPIGRGRPPDGVLNTPSVSGDTVYMAAAGFLYAFDKNTGAIRWATPLAASSFSPAIANGVVYLTGETPSGTPALFAVDATTGAILATVTVNEPLATGAV